jgi:hypothetical protein
MGVAHGIHSMTLQELQYFFDADATEDNKIPMINFNLSSPDLVLPSIPDLKLNNSFLTPSMNSVDHILSNWETEDFIMKNASVLELLVHNLHMYETLSLAGKIYKKIKRDQRKRNEKTWTIFVTASMEWSRKLWMNWNSQQNGLERLILLTASIGVDIMAIGGPAHAKSKHHQDPTRRGRQHPLYQITVLGKLNKPVI